MYVWATCDGDANYVARTTSRESPSSSGTTSRAGNGKIVVLLIILRNITPQYNFAHLNGNCGSLSAPARSLFPFVYFLFWNAQFERGWVTISVSPPPQPPQCFPAHPLTPIQLRSLMRIAEVLMCNKHNETTQRAKRMMKRHIMAYRTKKFKHKNEIAHRRKTHDALTSTISTRVRNLTQLLKTSKVVRNFSSSLFVNIAFSFVWLGLKVALWRLFALWRFAGKLFISPFAETRKWKHRMKVFY